MIRILVADPETRHSLFNKKIYEIFQVHSFKTVNNTCHAFSLVRVVNESTHTDSGLVE